MPDIGPARRGHAQRRQGPCRNGANNRLLWRQNAAVGHEGDAVLAALPSSSSQRPHRAQSVQDFQQPDDANQKYQRRQNLNQRNLGAIRRNNVPQQINVNVRSGCNNRLDFQRQDDANQQYQRRQNLNQRNIGAIGRNNVMNPLQMGFKDLMDIAESDSKEVIVQINDRKQAFLNTLEMRFSADKMDMNILIVKVISKICGSAFQQLKSALLIEISNSSFVANLRIYLMDLPYASREEKMRNKFYWNNQQEFWDNFVTFCECIIDISPSTALHKCRSLIDSVSKCCLDLLSDRHEFNLQNECNMKLIQLRERLIVCESEDKKAKSIRNLNPFEVNEEPPDNFRELSVVPTAAELMGERAFVRPNLVRGAYRDTEHYLDVQFRLLREDCFGPLRDGLIQYVQNPEKHRFDNIRVFRNVMITEPYISTNSIGVIVQLDGKTMKRFKKINWSHSKRFNFGSLLLFTKDNCKSFATATIIDRNVKLLNQGKIPVSIIVDMENNTVQNYHSYVMIESEVYFEPYLHVLQALQNPKFPEHIAMHKYIVKTEPHPNPPAYLNPASKYKVNIEDGSKTIFNVFEELTWPTNTDLGLNESQYEAYKLALTHEFTLIQGPPGTGKTYVGIKVAETLIKNLSALHTGPLMLVICYTNHALDQFLEAISSSVTNLIARIGGQSKNEAMEKYKLINLRKNFKQSKKSNKLFYDHKNALNEAVNKLKGAQQRVNSLLEGIISYDSIEGYVRECKILRQYYDHHRSDVKSDPLKHWLFEQIERVPVDFQKISSEDAEEQDIEHFDIGDNNDHERIDLILDDFEDDHKCIYISDQQIYTSFSLEDTENELKSVISLYKKCERGIQQELQRKIVDLKSRIMHFNKMAANQTRDIKIQISPQTNFGIIPIENRWAIYFKWAAIVVDEMKKHVKDLQEALTTAKNTYEESRMLLDTYILKEIKVIGMTTSGAAKLQKLLQALAPPIVIVEEAAEVLEQHIVTALTKHCKHLILIGDHQQLRPSAAHLRLARYFNIEISLFERMIGNGMENRRLAVQHRMRPEIAALISPHIYAELLNHPSVERFPKVRGLTDNLFFLTHEYKEENVEDSASRSNCTEGDMALRLANYIMQQGYDASDVTILAAYSGQMFYMKKQRESYAFLTKVKITVVDNYQGEESKIIILSLVRNNNDNKIGFLGNANRVCVALSRAKEGFYILGNIEILKRNSELWMKIATTLNGSLALGSMLMLKCENHPSQISTISSPKDFDKVPEGGCLLKCNYSLPCGHPCALICHSYDRGHVSTKCHKSCQRVLCELGHVCPLVCWTECKPCRRVVEKIIPKCGHKILLFCHVEATDPSVKCTTNVTVTLPQCGHQVKKPCYMDIAAVKCPVPCAYRVDSCGHECRLTCHVRDDPDHEKYLCDKPCAKAKTGCTANLIGDRGPHQCVLKCHQSCDSCTTEVLKKRSTCRHSVKVACNVDADATPCRQKCTRKLPDCEHFCKRKCFEKCGDCQQMVKKIISECSHEIEVKCMEKVSREQCKYKCERILSCGHPCKDACNETCDPKKCVELIPYELQSPCGHKVLLPCNIYNTWRQNMGMDQLVLLEYCKAPCAATLACEHECGGTCGECHQGRLHVACTRPCHQTIICGHQCKEPCSQVCPPCTVRCEIKCRHSRCKNTCGAPCVPCQEKCTRKCIHGECTRRCGEPCSRPPCNEKCPKVFKCGHPCRGLCGEPCPDLCKQCRPEQFPKGLIGEDYEDDDILIKIEDCSHFLDVETMDNLMMGDRECVQIRACPFCRKPIVNTHRYKDLVNHMFKTEINPIKQRVYGTEAIIKNKREQLDVAINLFMSHYSSVFTENKALRGALHKLINVVKSQKKVSLLQLDMQSHYLKILDLIKNSYKRFKDDKLIEMKDEFLKVIELLCCALAENINKISQQLQIDIGNEVKRLNSIIQFSKILSHSSYLSLKTANKVAEAQTEAKKIVMNFGVFNETETLEALSGLQNTLNIFGIVGKQERDLIVQAIGSKAGSWYKCPNGHFYSISDCGGAMQVSYCADCKAPIGGSNHRLLSTNRHAGEVDGSSHAAWSDAYDNMANFNFN